MPYQLFGRALLTIYNSTFKIYYNVILSNSLVYEIIRNITTNT